MPIPPLLLDEDLPELRDGLRLIREELDVPGPHGSEAIAEAEAAARRVLRGLDSMSGADRIDARDVPFVTIDPPGSRDLDQAVHLERRTGGGFRVRYAIADAGAFIAAGSALDREVWDRGVTYYLPDARAPLHPPVIGEGAASLLPGQVRPAVVWTIDLDQDGVAGTVRLERAIVRSRTQLTYTEVQAAVDGGRAEGTESLLAEVGPLRQSIEAARGGVSLDLPTQRVVRDEGGYRLELEHVVPAMGWNAQISLLTGMVAARTMLSLAARGLRGAGYLALGADQPEAPTGSAAEHAAVAAPYAHVTAPLRRLGDRFAIEVCVALLGDTAPAPEVVDALDDLPKALAKARGREGSVARACIDLVETLMLRSLVGEVLDATVVAASDGRSTVVMAAPAVQADIVGLELPLGEPVRVRVDAADPVARQVQLSVA